MIGVTATPDSFRRFRQLSWAAPSGARKATWCTPPRPGCPRSACRGITRRTSVALHQLQPLPFGVVEAESRAPPHRLDLAVGYTGRVERLPPPLQRLLL